MPLTIFGQPQDGVIQMSYVVKDIHQAMNEWIDKLKVGPWFLLPHFTGVDALYRGQPTSADVSIAMSFAGHMWIELIQPLDDAPSVYREAIDQRGYGFHHWGVGTPQFDRDVARYQAAGCELAFFARVPSGGRVAYMDTTTTLPGMTELIELGASFDSVFSRMYRATIGWDTSDPIRSFM
ncbi:MAG TPA: VOC family protein [Candidatus Dormibacteraeota bacterium]|nr:VOC family protein [Candidatus Dormibacteraeota bacterium]